MKKKLLLFVFIFFVSLVYAQFDPPPFDPAAPPTPPEPSSSGPGAEGSGRGTGVPLDGWEWIFLVGAGAYGIMSFKNKQALDI